MPMLLTKLMAAGLGSGLANAFCADTADNQTATGTTQATAFETSTAFVRFTTVASGSGCLLDNGARGDSQYIVNAGANALLVYPHVGGTINQLSANAGFSIPAGSWAAFDRYTDALWTAANDSASTSFIQSGTGASSGTAQDELRRHVYAEQFGASASASAATNTTAITNAIASITKGVVQLGYGTFNHTGITGKAGVTIRGKGPSATVLNNTGTGANILLPDASNYAAVEDIGLTGVSGSAHGLHVLDSIWVNTRRLSITSWGQNSAGLRLDTLNNTGGNGCYYGEHHGIDINGQARTGTIGVHQTGTAAGANRHRFYGGSVRNCVTGIKMTNGDALAWFQAEVSGCTTGLAGDGANAANSKWFAPSFESNTEHVNLAAGSADHVFIFPTFATPIAFGTDNGSRTNILYSDSSSTGAGKLTGELTGISFPATQVPSSSVNTLDDYEEFTWVPVDSSGAGLVLTVTGAQGVKVGQDVTISASITFPATGDVTNVLIGGFPFTSKTTTDAQYGGAPSYTNFGTAVMLLVRTGDTKFEIFDYAGAQKTNANFSGKLLRFSIKYRAAA